MTEQARYDAAHDPMDHHCLIEPCEWHPAETRIRPQAMSTATLIDRGIDAAYRIGYQRGQRDLAAKVEALAEEWATEGHALLPVRDPHSADFADDLRALLADALPQEETPMAEEQTAEKDARHQWRAEAEKVLAHGCQVRPDCRWCKESQRIIALLDALDACTCTGRPIPPGSTDTLPREDRQ